MHLIAVRRLEAGEYLLGTFMLASTDALGLQLDAVRSSRFEVFLPPVFLLLASLR